MILFYFVYDSAVNKPFDLEGEIKVFEVENGWGLSRTSRALKEEGLISSNFFFNFLARGKSIQAGIYELSAGMNMREIIRALSSGETISNERTVKLIEGWNNNDMALYFEKENLFLKDEFLKEAKSKDKYSALSGVHLVASLVKRLILGTFQGRVDSKYLQNYLDEYVFRFNRRTSRNIGKKFMRIVQQVATSVKATCRQIKTESNCDLLPQN